MPVLHLLAPLERFYGPLAMPPHDPFRSYVWEALSTQTTPGRRDAAYAALLRVPALTPDSMFRASRAKLAAAATLAGPSQEQRLHALIAGAERFRRRPQLTDTIRGPIRQARRALATLPRLGEASIHRLLLYGGEHCIMPVDRDTARLCVRLGLDADMSHPGRTAKRLRRALARALPNDAATFKHAALYLRHHATQTCTDDPHCHVCPLADTCPGKRDS